MDFKTVLLRALEMCGKNACDPFLLYCALSDSVGDDYKLKLTVDRFYKFDSKYRVVREIYENREPKTIGRILGKCGGNDGPPLKELIHWVFDIFVFYYKGEKKKNGAEEAINALKEDFFALVDNESNEAQTKPASVKRTYQYQPISPPPPKTYQLSPRYRYLGRPIVNLVKLGGQIKLTPARGANAPRIEGLQCFNLVAPPNAIYKTFPDDAVVYLGGSSPNIHVSSQCPSIKYAFKIYRASYDQARYEDFFRMYKFCDANLARHHIPPVCATCGSFVPDIEGIMRKVEDL